ncbi:MAG: NADAR family protein [Prolixibacteraceae bacterium]|nr:NADAR family protein [Prolixibacteraceae bacterium]
MKYNLDWLIGSFEKGKKFKYIFFWGHPKSKNGNLTQSCFSQWWTSPFTVEGVKYNTAEHWMMAQKALLFRDTETFQKIILAKSPTEAKSLGRQVRNFKEEVWVSKRMEIVVQGTLQKFKQNQELKQFLISTKDKVLVEASPVDKIWGTGLAAENEKIENPKCWKGLNLLGFALMEVRDILTNKE